MRLDEAVVIRTSAAAHTRISHTGTSLPWVPIQVSCGTAAGSRRPGHLRAPRRRPRGLPPRDTARASSAEDEEACPELPMKKEGSATSPMPVPVARAVACAGPVTGDVEQVVLEGGSRAPVPAASAAAGASGAGALGAGAFGGALVPPGVIQLSDGVAQPRADGAGVAADQMLDGFLARPRGARAIRAEPWPVTCGAPKPQPGPAHIQQAEGEVMDDHRAEGHHLSPPPQRPGEWARAWLALRAEPSVRVISGTSRPPAGRQRPGGSGRRAVGVSGRGCAAQNRPALRLPSGWLATHRASWLSARSWSWPGAGRCWCRWGSRRAVTADQSRLPWPPGLLMSW